MARANPRHPPGATPPFHRPSGPRNQDPTRSGAVQAGDQTPHQRADDRFPAIDPCVGPNHPDGGSRANVCHPWSDVTGGDGATSVPVAAQSQQSQRLHTPGSAERHPWIKARSQPVRSRADSWHATVRHAAVRSKADKPHSAYDADTRCAGNRSDKPPTSEVVLTGRGNCDGHELQNAADPH